MTATPQPAVNTHINRTTVHRITYRCGEVGPESLCEARQDRTEFTTCRKFMVLVIAVFVDIFDVDIDDYPNPKILQVTGI